MGPGPVGGQSTAADSRSTADGSRGRPAGPTLNSSALKPCTVATADARSSSSTAAPLLISTPSTTPKKMIPVAPRYHRVIGRRHSPAG